MIAFRPLGPCALVCFRLTWTLERPMSKAVALETLPLERLRGRPGTLPIRLLALPFLGLALFTCQPWSLQAAFSQTADGASNPGQRIIIVIPPVPPDMVSPQPLLEAVRLP